MNILLITHNFPPLNKIGSLRTYCWAKYWARTGNKVTVLTTSKYRFDGPLDLLLPFEKNIAVVEVDYIPFRSLFLNKINSKNSMSNSKIKNEESDSFTGKLKNVVRSFRRNFLGSVVDVHDLWIFFAVRKGKAIMSEQEVDMLISSYGPPASHIVASRLKKMFPKVPWVADYRDLWSQNPYNCARGIFKRVEAFMEKKTVGKYANLLTTVSQPLAEQLKSMFHQSVEVVENGFDPDYSKMEILRNKKHIGKPLKLVYTGNIYTGKRDPTPLFKALNRLEEERGVSCENIRVCFYGNIVGDLKEIVRREKADRWVEYCGQVEWHRALDIQRNADVLIFLESNDDCTKGVFTGKLFEYLISGTPILAIGITAEHEAGKLIKESGTGIVVNNDVEKIKLFLGEILNNEAWNAYNPKWQVIEKFSREKLSMKLLSLCARL